MKQNLVRIPYSGLKIIWNNEVDLSVSLPWMTVNIEVDPKDKSWVKEASDSIHINPEHPFAQKFLDNLKDIPCFYSKTRSLDEFENRDLETTLLSLEDIDFSTPECFLKTLKIPFEKDFKGNLNKNWEWPADDILEKAKISGTNLYDPVAFNTYLSLVRLEFAGKGWEGSGGIYTLLKDMLSKDENTFFTYMGWCARQSHYITSNACQRFSTAMKNFPYLRPHLKEYLADEVGHHKFMEDIVEKLDFSLDDFQVGSGSKFIIDSLSRMGDKSALAFVSTIGLFEAYTFEENDPLARILRQSSKPDAAKGYELHHEINHEHNHSAVGQLFCTHLGPQRKEDCLLTIRIYELCLHLLNSMEKNMPKLAFLKLKETAEYS